MVHQIDARDKIFYVDAEWLKFGRQNQLLIQASEIIGTRIYEYIAGVQTRDLYYHVLKNVREHNMQVVFPFRCDSPDRRRFLMMYVRPLPEGGVKFKSSILREELREPLALLEPGRPHSDERLGICSICRRVDAGGGRWLEVEDAVRMLGLFETETLPQIHHCTCAQCEQTILN